MRAGCKIWGTTIELFANNTTSTHYLEIRAGGYCSEHRHAQKENIFYVISGELEILYWVDAIRYSRTLAKGESHTIPIGVWHLFKAKGDTKCIEIYDYKYDGVDIERRAQGGVL